MSHEWPRVLGAICFQYVTDGEEHDFGAFWAVWVELFYKCSKKSSELIENYFFVARCCNCLSLCSRDGCGIDGSRLVDC
jgi:hypothetical protein